MATKDELNWAFQVLQRQYHLLAVERNGYMAGYQQLANQITSQAKRHADEVMRLRRKLARRRRPWWRRAMMRLAAALRRRRIVLDYRDGN